MERIEVIASGQACIDCSLWIANRDDSGAPEGQPKPVIPESVLSEYPEANLIISGDESEVFCGVCDLCSTDHGYFEGFEWSALSR